MRNMLTTAVAAILGLSFPVLGCDGDRATGADGAVVEDTGVVADAGALDAGGADAGAQDVWPAPTYWTTEATKAVDDINWAYEKDPVSGGKRKFFAIGYDNSSRGPWDGVTGRDGCSEGPNGEAVGWIDNAVELNEMALDAGANFAYVWGSGRSKLGKAGGKIRGIYHNQWGIDPTPDKDVVPIIYNGGGESDIDTPRDAKIKELQDRFAAFKARTGDYDPANAPNLVTYDDMPWFAWHPTWRSNGGGTGAAGEEKTTDDEADGFAGATSMMIGDNYTYVTNKFDSSLNPITGQKGEKDEGYDLWLEKDDPDHRDYFTAAWEMTWSHVTRAKNGYADPAHPTVNWFWAQGFAFDDGIGESLCWNGNEDSYAKGPFPTLAYLRKEITSMIAAGGTGVIFFGHFKDRFPDAEKIRLFFRALSHPDVYGPALLSPRLDLGVDTQFLGEAGHDGKGRAHVIVKWHEETGTAYVIGSNPGARATAVEIAFPWTVAKAELLDWGTPATDEAHKDQFTGPAFVVSPDAAVYDTKVLYTIPRDEGFIMRITPLLAD